MDSGKLPPYLFHCDKTEHCINPYIRTLDNTSLDQGPRDINFITLTHKTSELKSMGAYK